MWPVIIAGILGFFAFEAIKASEKVAEVFGRLGRNIYHGSRHDTFRRVQRLEEQQREFERRMERANAYLVKDVEYHLEADTIIAARCPGTLALLPARISWSDFQDKWDAGWRPDVS